MGPPLIWPPTMNDALKSISLSCRYSPSRRSMSRIASAVSVATSNMVRAFQRLEVALPAEQRLFSTPMTAWVPARLPELRKMMTRSARRSNTVILQNFAMLSTPALVRESDANIIPLSSITPIQYVMPRALCSTQPPVIQAEGYTLLARITDAVLCAGAHSAQFARFVSVAGCAADAGARLPPSFSQSRRSALCVRVSISRLRRNCAVKAAMAPQAANIQIQRLLMVMTTSIRGVVCECGLLLLTIIRAG